MASPLSLSKSLPNPDACVYIYWKASGGDCMLILTNERIDDDKVQKNMIYLTCIIASLTTGTDPDLGYHERHTYISNSSSVSHNK